MVPAVTATGVEKSSSSQPWVDSFVNVPGGQLRAAGRPQRAGMSAGVIRAPCRTGSRKWCRCWRP